MSLGHGVRDIGAFLIQSLQVEDRKVCQFILHFNCNGICFFRKRKPICFVFIIKPFKKTELVDISSKSAFMITRFLFSSLLHNVCAMELVYSFSKSKVFISIPFCLSLQILLSFSFSFLSYITNLLRVFGSTSSFQVVRIQISLLTFDCRDVGFLVLFTSLWLQTEINLMVFDFLFLEERKHRLIQEHK